MLDPYSNRSRASEERTFLFLYDVPVVGDDLDLSFLYGLLVSVGIGALIGMERERRRAEDTVLVGVRTFPLVSTSGFVIGHLAVNEPFMDWLAIAGLILFGTVALLLVYVLRRWAIPGSPPH